MNRLTRVSAIFGIISSICMALLWGIFFMTGISAEIAGGPVFRGALIFDEALTSAGLMTAGIGLIGGKRWAPALFHASMGMLLYAVLFAAGKFAETAYAYLSILFILVAAATAAILCLHLLERHHAPGDQK